MNAPRPAVDVDTAPEPDGVKKLGTTVAVSDVCSALEDGVKKLGTKVDAVLGRLALPENDKPDAEAETVAFGTAVAEKLPEAETETEADVACKALALLVRCPVLPGEDAEVCFARVDVWIPVDEGMAVDGVKKLGTRVDVVLGKPAFPENDRPENAESKKAEAEAEKVAFGAAETEKLPDAVIVVEAEAEALALLVLVRCPVFPGEGAEVCFARLAVWIAVDVREGMAVDGVKKLGVSVAVVSALALALALALEEGVKKLETRDVADVLTLTGALADADAENEKGAFEDDAERKDPDPDPDAEGVVLALSDALLVRVWRTVDPLSLPDTAAGVATSIATPEDAEDAAEWATDPLGVKKAEEKRALALSNADEDENTEVDAVVDVAVALADTPLPLPTAVALALAVPENPPSVGRTPDAESDDVDALRSALALGLALFAVAVEVLKRPDVSGLLEISDAEADVEMLWTWLADVEKLTDDNDGDTDALGTKDAAALLFDRASEAEAETETEVGTPPVSPNDADADAGAEPTADAEAALKLLRVTECEKPALALSPPKAAETVETAELGVASVEVSDSLVVVNVDCAALALVLWLPVRELVRELDETKDALALAPDVVALFVFVPAKEVAEAVTDSTTLLLELVSTADAAVLSKLALAFAAEDKDDLSGALVEVKDVVVVAGVDVVVGKPVVVLACAWVALARLDSPFWSMADADTDAEGKVAADVVSPSTTLELELDTSTSDPVLVSAVVEGTGSDTLCAPKRRCIKSIGGIKIKKSRKLT